MELVLTLPILGVVLLGLFEFTWLFYARGQVVEASRIAARHGTLPGASIEDLEVEVRQIVPPSWSNSVRVAADLGEHPGDRVQVAVEVPMAAVAPDLLWPIGLGLAGRNLYAETRMVKE